MGGDVRKVCSKYFCIMEYSLLIRMKLYTLRNEGANFLRKAAAFWRKYLFTCSKKRHDCYNWSGFAVWLFLDLDVGGRAEEA